MSRRVGIALGLALCLTAAVLRFHQLGHKSFDSAEIALIAAQRMPDGERMPAAHDFAGRSFTEPLIVDAIAESSLDESRLRAPNAIFGTAAVAGAFWLFASTFGYGPGFGAALLLAISPLHLEYSQHVGPEAPLAAVTVAFLIAMWRLLARGEGLLAAAALAVAGCFTHYSFVFVLGGVAFYTAVARAAKAVESKAAAKAAGAIAIGLVAIAPFAVSDLRYGLGGQLILSNVNWTVPGLLANGFGFGSRAPQLAIATLAVASLSVFGFASALRSQRAPALFLFSAFAASTVGTLIVDRTAPYLFSAAQVLNVLPVYLGFAAVGAAVLVRAVPIRAVSFAGSAALVALALAAAALALPAYYGRNSVDWRGVAEILLRNVGKDDAVATPFGRQEVLFYAPELERRIGTADRPESIQGALLWADRAWIVAPWPARLSPRWPAVRSFLESRIVLDFSPAPDLRLLYVTNQIGRRRTCYDAMQFELPAAVLAHGTALRDCVAELGPTPSVLAQIDVLVRSGDVSLRNPALLQVVTLLKQAGEVQRARGLAVHIAAVEPEWRAAAAAKAALSESGS